jgi:F-type H+-transporting ATPase subunit b
MVLAELSLGPIAFHHPKALLASILGFALLLWLLGRYAVPSWRTGLNTRSSLIADAHDQAERQLADAQQIRNDYADRIASIEVEHRHRLEVAIRDSDAARADIIADAQEATRALRRRAEEEIARERTRQRILLRRQIVQITLDAAEEAILDLNSDEAQHRLIADFVTRVGGPAGNGHSAVAPADGSPTVAAAPAPVAPAPSAAAAQIQSQEQRGV